MDESTVSERLQRIETKLDEIKVFTDQLQVLADMWMRSGRGRLATALVKARGGAK